MKDLRVLRDLRDLKDLWDLWVLRDLKRMRDLWVLGRGVFCLAETPNPSPLKQREGLKPAPTTANGL